MSPMCSTSDITDAIDWAFVDRVNIKQYVGTLSQGSVYQIMHSCAMELVGNERG